MRKLLIFIVLVFIYGCDKVFVIPFNGENKKTIHTECGTIHLALTTLGYANFTLSCLISVDSTASVLTKNLKILVNGKDINYNVWQNNNQIDSDVININKSSEVDYLFNIYLERKDIREIKIVSEQFLQVDSEYCGFEPVIVKNIQ